MENLLPYLLLQLTFKTHTLHMVPFWLKLEAIGIFIITLDIDVYGTIITTALLFDIQWYDYSISIHTYHPKAIHNKWTNWQSKTWGPSNCAWMSQIDGLDEHLWSLGNHNRSATDWKLDNVFAAYLQNDRISRYLPTIQVHLHTWYGNSEIFSKYSREW